MARYLLLWELDRSKIPVSPQERAAGFGALVNGVKEELRKGSLKDWGAFVGEMSGYAVAEGTEVEIGSLIQRYVPFVFFKTYAVASISQVDEANKALLSK